MTDRAPETDRRTLAWLDDALRRTRPENRTGLVNLLTLVRAEILFDIAFSEDPSLVRNFATAEVPGADRTVSEPGGGPR